jgi:hypothetical protein
MHGKTRRLTPKQKSKLQDIYQRLWVEREKHESGVSVNEVKP